MAEPNPDDPLMAEIVSGTVMMNNLNIYDQRFNRAWKIDLRRSSVI